MKLDTRQKILIPLIIIAFIYVGWQLYHIFLASSPNQALPHPVTTAQASSEQTTLQSTTRMEQDRSVMPYSEKIAVPQQKTIEKLSSEAATGQSATYLRLVKQYRELEAKRMLLEEKMAIAETQQKIDELNAKLAKFSDTEVNTSISNERAYKLIYLDRQNGQWSATLSDNNVFREVKVGTELSDGSKIVAMNSKGVILTKDGKTELLTFSGTVPLSETKVRMISPIQKIIEPVHSKVVVQKIEKHKISELNSVAPKHIVKLIKHTSLQPKKISKVQLTNNPMPTEKTAVEPDYTVKPASLVANYSVRPIKKTSSQKSPITTKNNNVTVIELAPKQTKPKPLIANYSIRSVKSVSLQVPPKVENNSAAVVQLASKQMKLVKSKLPIANYSVRPIKKTSSQKSPITTKNNNVTVIELAPKQTKPKPPIANYSVRPVKSVSLQTPPKIKKSKSITVVQLTTKQMKPMKSKPLIANHSVKLVKSIPLQTPSKIRKGSSVTVVQLAPKQIKSVKLKPQRAKRVDLTYKVNVTPPVLPKSKIKTMRHTKITQLIPTPAKSNNNVTKVTKTMVKKPIHKKKTIQTNRGGRPIGFSPLPAKNNTGQNNNSPIILMN